jgi:hypothetical protein
MGDLVGLAELSIGLAESVARRNTAASRYRTWLALKFVNGRFE